MILNVLERLLLAVLIIVFITAFCLLTVSIIEKQKKVEVLNQKIKLNQQKMDVIKYKDL